MKNLLDKNIILELATQLKDDGYDTTVFPAMKAMPPFEKYENGFGYKGVLLWDSMTDLVQCHLCGKWFKFLTIHLCRSFKCRINPYNYRKMVGLNLSTPLISESVREHFSTKAKTEKNLSNYLENNPNPRQLNKTNYKDKTHSVEHYNKFGTCQSQLKTRLERLIIELGRVPKKRECYFSKTLIRRFGTWNKALIYFGYNPINLKKISHEKPLLSQRI